MLTAVLVAIATKFCHLITQGQIKKRGAKQPAIYQPWSRTWALSRGEILLPVPTQTSLESVSEDSVPIALEGLDSTGREGSSFEEETGGDTELPRRGREERGCTTSQVTMPGWHGQHAELPAKRKGHTATWVSSGSDSEAAAGGGAGLRSNKKSRPSLPGFFTLAKRAGAG